MNQIIYSIDALAGRGKTYSALRWAKGVVGAERRKVVIVFKSIALLRQAERDFHQIKTKGIVPLICIHSNNGDKQSVFVRLKRHLARPGGAQLLFVTEAAFLGLSDWPNRQEWTCICDEIPTITPAHKLNIPDNHQLLSKYLRLPRRKNLSAKFSQAGRANPICNTLPAIGEMMR